MAKPERVKCPHCGASLKPKFASNHIPACKKRTAEQSQRDKGE